MHVILIEISKTWTTRLLQC